MTVVTLKTAEIPVDADIICSDLTEEMGGLLDMRNYYRDFDVQDHKNNEAIAKAELAAVVFRVKRCASAKNAKDKHIDEVVEATTKATIATARRMKREEELAGYERKITYCKKRADAAGVTFPVGWLD